MAKYSNLVRQIGQFFGTRFENCQVSNLAEKNRLIFHEVREWPLFKGRTYSGIKRLFLPCCIKGKFYANLTLLHKGKMLCQPRLAVTARQAFMPSSLA